MGVLTGLLYACLAVFAAGWYFDKWSGNFSLLLFILSVVTFGYWLAERFHFAPQRRRAVAEFEKQDARAARAARRPGHHPGRRQQRRDPPGPADAALVARLDRGPVPGDPRRLPAALVPVRAVQDPVRVDEADAAGRRPDPGQQVPLRRPPAGDQQEDRRHQRPAARRRDGVPLSAGPEHRLHQARRRPAGRRGLVPRPEALRQRPGRAARRRPASSTTTIRVRYEKEFIEQLGPVQHHILINPQTSPFFGTSREPHVSVPRKLPLQCRRRDLQGASRPLFHDGRQPRQLPGLALLGLRAGREHRRQGILRVDELRRPEAHRVVPSRCKESADQEPRSSRRGRGQRGVTLFGLLFWAIVVGFVALIGMRVLPTLNEYFTIKRAVNKIAAEG